MIHIFIWVIFLKVLGIIAIVWLALGAFVLLVLHLKSHRLIRSIILNALLGFVAIAIINITQKFTGVFVPLNWYTIGGSGIFGLPCVCGVVLLQIFI